MANINIPQQLLNLDLNRETIDETTLKSFMTTLIRELNNMSNTITSQASRIKVLEEKE